MKMIEAISLLERVYDRVVGKPGAGARVLADRKMAKYESLIVGPAKQVGIDGTPQGPNESASSAPTAIAGQAIAMGHPRRCGETRRSGGWRLARPKTTVQPSG